MPRVRAGSFGDAALASDPLWAVGCGWAFESAEWLVESTAEALLAGRGLARSLGRYRRRHRAALAGHHVTITSYSTGWPLLPHERLFLAAATRDPVTARRLAAFGERLIGPSRMFTPRNVGRALAIVVADRLRRAGARFGTREVGLATPGVVPSSSTPSDGRSPRS